MKPPRDQSPSLDHFRRWEADPVRVTAEPHAAPLPTPSAQRNTSEHWGEGERIERLFSGRVAWTKSLLLCLGTLVFWASAGASQLSGEAVVVSGDTLVVAGERVRLLGVDAPGLGQICRRATGIEWRCGLLAKLELARHIDGRPVACDSVGHDEFGQRVAICNVAGAELGAWLVERGWALAAGDAHAEVEAEAREAGRGLWHDSFAPPIDWRLAAALPHRSEDENALDACACTARHKSFQRSAKP